MSDVAEEGERRAKILELLRQDKQRREKQDSAVAELLRRGEIPTPVDARRIINMRVGEARQFLLSNHIYWKERKLRQGLKALIDTSRRAYIDIIGHNAALGALARGRWNFHEHVDHAITEPVQKDVMAFCSAAHATIDTVRRVRKLREDVAAQIEEVISASFSDDVCDFIMALRMNISHGSVSLPRWSVHYSKGTSDGVMNFAASDILSFGDWNGKSKRYIRSCEGGEVNIAEAIGEYFNRLTKFYWAVEDIFARNPTPAETDFYDIEDSFRRRAAGQWIKVLVSQVGKNLDPYDYLHHFFDSSEVRQILRRARHSKEQVDYLIALKDTEIECDESLRDMLYRYFGVKADV